MGINYDNYEMNCSEKVKGFGVGFAIAFGVIWIFYRIGVMALVGGIIGGAFGMKKNKTILIERRKDRLLEQFKSLLEALATSYSAGKNTLSAYRDAKGDMIRFYGEDSYIVKEIELILDNYNNNIMIEKSLSDFAQRTGLEDIKSFSEVYESCHRAGGDIGKVIGDTRQIIMEKIDMEKEIKSGINASKSNLNLIVAIGLVIVVMTGADSSMSISVNTPVLFGIKSVCLLVMALSYWFGLRLTEIKL